MKYTLYKDEVSSDLVLVLVAKLHYSIPCYLFFNKDKVGLVLSKKEAIFKYDIKVTDKEIITSLRSFQLAYHSEIPDYLLSDLMTKLENPEWDNLNQTLKTNVINNKAHQYFLTDVHKYNPEFLI